MLDDLSFRIPAPLIRISIALHPAIPPDSTLVPQTSLALIEIRSSASPSSLHPSQENISSQTLLSSFSKYLLRSQTVSTCVARSHALNTFPQNSSLLSSGGARWSWSG